MFIYKREKSRKKHVAFSSIHAPKKKKIPRLFIPQYSTFIQFILLLDDKCRMILTISDQENFFFLSLVHVASHLWILTKKVTNFQLSALSFFHFRAEIAAAEQHFGCIVFIECISKEKNSEFLYLEGYFAQISILFSISWYSTC